MLKSSSALNRILFMKRYFFEFIPLAITALFWIFTINGLPARVSKLEIEVNELKAQIINSSVKTDIILEDVKFLKQFVLQKMN